MVRPHVLTVHSERSMVIRAQGGTVRRRARAQGAAGRAGEEENAPRSGVSKSGLVRPIDAHTEDFS
jgi:hypothetical protein